VIQYGEAYVNEFAPFLWEFTSCEVPNLGIRAPLVNTAMWNIATRRLFFMQFGDLQYRIVRQYVRRSIYAAKHYTAMRRRTADYFKGHRRDRPKLASYFDALAEAESCLLNLHILADCLKTLDEGLVGSGTHTKVKLLANSIKHFGGQSKGNPGNPIIPIYFKNSGISNGGYEISFTDLRDLVRQSASAARAIVNRRDD
jgi:hypothetical protein